MNDNIFFKKLGKLDSSICQVLKNKIDGLIESNSNTLGGFTRVEFDKNMYLYMKHLFRNTELKVQKSNIENKLIQKAFISDSLYTFPIHKDGIKCKSALNIVLQCNNGDWVRWYDEDFILSMSTTRILLRDNKSSRNSDIPLNLINTLPYLKELKMEDGDVYALNVDMYHTWHCAGPNKRIIIQTKFDNFPDFYTIANSLTKSCYSNMSKS